MNVYEIAFILSTLWVGPFWFAMMLKPHDEKTVRMMNQPFFFAGPVLIWYITMFISPGGLSDFAAGFSDENGFVVGLAKSLSSEAGVTALWAHMVAGDIFATRWIWKKSIEKKINPILRNVALFFGVMLMPLGILFYVLGLILVKKKKKF